MYSHYEQRQERTSRNYERIDDSHNTLSPTSASTTYRSSVGPRVNNVQRSRPSGLTAPGVSTRIYQSYISTGANSGFGPGLASLVNFPGIPLRGGTNGVNTAIVSINTARQRDKRDLEHLNDKFAQYVEKVRYLEAHNRKLALELEALRSRSGQGTSRIKEMYDIEIAEANKLIDDTKRNAAIANAKKQQIEPELKRQRARYNNISGSRETDRREIDAIQQQIAENEAQIALLRRRMADLEDESRRYKAETQRLSSEIARVQNEIQNELFLKSSCEVEKLTLEDDISSLKHLNEADLAELRSQSVTNDLNPTQFFRNELSEAIREIRNDYEARSDNQRNDLQNHYSLLTNEIIIRTQQRDASPLFNEQQRQQVQRIRSELLQTQNQNTYLRNKNQEIQNSIAYLQQKIKDVRDDDALAKAKAERDIDEARNQLKRVERNYTDVTAFKTSLEKEIATYREFLESPNGLRGCVDRIVQNAEQKPLDRYSANNYLYVNRESHTTNISRTYVNTTGSNYGHEDSNTATSVSNPISQSTAAPILYQTLSSPYRNVPIRDDTTRNSSLWDDTSRDYTLLDNTTRDYTFRDNAARDYTVRDSINRNSSIPDSASSSSRESLIRDNNVNENEQNKDYETLSNT